MKKLFPILLTVVIVFLLIPDREANSQKLDLSSFLLETYEDNLQTRFSVEVDDFEKIKTALDNGSKVALLCDVSIFKNRIIFWNMSVEDREIEIGLEKDLLSGKYNIIYPDQKRSLDSFEKSDFLEQFGDMKIELVPMDMLESGQKYTVRIQVKLISRGVPKWIKRTLFFWSWDLARSIRYEMEFSL